MSQQSDDGYNDNPVSDYNEHGLAGLERDRERNNKPTPPAPNDLLFSQRLVPKLIEERDAVLARIKELELANDEITADWQALHEKLRVLEVKYAERGMAIRETGDMVRSLYEPRIKNLERALAYAKRWITPGDWSDDTGNKKNPRLEIERLERGE